LRRNRAHRILRYLVLGAGVLLAVVAARFAAFNITRSYPLEYRENAVILTTSLLLEGVNPYDIENQPIALNDYGLLYNWTVLALAGKFGPGFVVHRLVSTAYLLLTAGCLYWACRIGGVSRLLSAVTALVLFALLAGGLSIVSRPDSLGMLLFLAALVIPIRFRFSAGALVVSALLSVLGFMAKPYFLFGAPCLALYLFLFESKRKGLLYALGFGGAMALAVLVLHARYETYFSSTFFIHLNIAGRDFEHLLRVLRAFLATTAGFWAVLLWGAARALFDARATGRRSPRTPLLVVRSPGKPLLTRALPMPVFMLFCGLGAMLGKMGWHWGNGVLYYDQLVLPFLLWSMVDVVDKRLCDRWPATAIVLLNVLLVSVSPRYAAADFTRDFEVLATLMSEHKDVFHCPPLAHVARLQGKTVYDTGHTEYYRWGEKGNPTATIEEYLARGDAWRRMIQEKTRTRQFDLLLVTHGYSPLLDMDLAERHYDHHGTLPMRMMRQSWGVDVWKPKTDVGRQDRPRD